MGFIGTLVQAGETIIRAPRRPGCGFPDAECPGGDVTRQIERAEAWLAAHPHDPALLLTLGRLCVQQELWGKAQSYIEASLSVEPSRAAHAAYAQLMEKMGKPEEALRYNRRKR